MMSLSSLSLMKGRDSSESQAHSVAWTKPLSFFGSGGDNPLTWPTPSPILSDYGPGIKQGRRIRLC